MISKTLKVQGITPLKSANGAFTQMCQDILASETSRVGSKTNQDRVKEIVKELVRKEVGAGKLISVPIKALSAGKKTKKEAVVV